jgi:hypothetical protein
MTTPVLAAAFCHCGHVDEVHDPVATRYCSVTLDQDLPRSCVCRVPEAPARSYDHR